MAKHYLLTRKSKGLSIKDLARMSDEEAFELFRKIRWAKNDGNPVCPKCGNTKRNYFYSDRKQFRCGSKGCRHTYSVTSGTIFQTEKTDIQTCLMTILLSTQKQRLLSALQDCEKPSSSKYAKYTRQALGKERGE